MRLFSRWRQPAPTGHPGDDELLAQIGRRSALAEPRYWVHYLYVADEPTARSAAGEVLSDGWDLQKVASAADGRSWVVVAEQHDAVLSPDRVAAARRFFEALAARSAGGEYDGWETSC